MSFTDDNMCPYNFVGKSGLRVSNICLGAMTFGHSHLGMPGNIDEAEAHRLMDRYVEWGGNFIDTSDSYGPFESENIVGNWLQKSARENIVVATKVRLRAGNPMNVNAEGLSRRHITESIDRSLERLKTHYVDLYQTHAWDAGVTVDETYRTLDDLVRCGKVRYVGVSNVSGWQTQKILDTSEKLGLNQVISLQQQYNLLCRDSEFEAFQVCKGNGVGVLPWSPLSMGKLAGKVKRGEQPKDGRTKWAYDNKATLHPVYTREIPNLLEVIEAVEDIANKRGKTSAQVSLRWLLQRDVVSSVIIGARTLAQLDENMGANGWTLTKEEMERLDTISLQPLSPTYELLESIQEGRANRQANDYHVASDY